MQIRSNLITHYFYQFLPHQIVLKRLSTHYKTIKFTESALKAKTFEDEENISSPLCFHYFWRINIQILCA